MKNEPNVYQVAAEPRAPDTFNPHYHDDAVAGLIYKSKKYALGGLGRCAFDEPGRVFALRAVFAMRADELRLGMRVETATGSRTLYGIGQHSTLLGGPVTKIELYWASPRGRTDSVECKPERLWRVLSPVETVCNATDDRLLFGTQDELCAAMTELRAGKAQS